MSETSRPVAISVELLEKLEPFSPSVRKVFRYLYVQQHDSRPPLAVSRQTIASKTDIKSLSAVSRALNTLEHEHFIRRHKKDGCGNTYEIVYEDAVRPGPPKPDNTEPSEQENSRDSNKQKQELAAHKLEKTTAKMNPAAVSATPQQPTAAVPAGQSMSEQRQESAAQEQTETMVGKNEPPTKPKDSMANVIGRIFRPLQPEEMAAFEEHCQHLGKDRIQTGLNKLAKQGGVAGDSPFEFFMAALWNFS